MKDMNSTSILHIPKTGLPFLDVLRLYGALEIYSDDVQCEVFMHDAGHAWHLQTRMNACPTENSNYVQQSESQQILQQWLIALRRGALKPSDDAFMAQFHAALHTNTTYPSGELLNVALPLENPDSAIKAGVRDGAAIKYRGLEAGQGMKAVLPLADALLVFAGQSRMEEIAGIRFLPVFEGRCSVPEVVTSINLTGFGKGSIIIPSVLCVQVLYLLALKASLLVLENDCADCLVAVAYNTNYAPRGNYNFSGVIAIQSTLLSKLQSHRMASHILESYTLLLYKAWDTTNNNVSTDFTAHCLTMAEWVMQPTPKRLSALITGQEKLRCLTQSTNRYLNIFTQPTDVQEIFTMSYTNWSGNVAGGSSGSGYEAVRKFAKAVSSAIWETRQRTAENKGKAWYDEVSILRSASTPKAFRERALTLLEQAHRRNPAIATIHREEDFDPIALLASVGDDRREFEAFRDLFRMYLIQQSTYREHQPSPMPISMPVPAGQAA